MCYFTNNLQDFDSNSEFNDENDWIEWNLEEDLELDSLSTNSNDLTLELSLDTEFTTKEVQSVVRLK